MIKRGVLYFIAALISFAVFSTIVSAACNLDADLINQDPYPAVPNSYVSLVFQLNDVKNPDCGGAFFEAMPEYPFSIDGQLTKIVQENTFSDWYQNAWIVQYKVRVDKDALNGNAEIKVKYGGLGKAHVYNIKKFNVSIEDSRTDFDIAVQDYSYKTNTLTLAVSNIGDENATSVTVILPEQAGIEIMASDKNIVGGIDTNDYTIASFKVMPNGDSVLTVLIDYTDSIGVRRQVEKEVMFKASVYNSQEKISEDGSSSRGLIYILVGIAGIAVILVLFRIFKKRKTKI